MITTTSYSLSGRTITLDVVLDETSDSLNYLSGVVNWGDGTTTSIPRTLKSSGQVVRTLTHAFVNPGFYVVEVTGRNYRSPTPDTDLSVIYLSLDSAPIIEVNSGFIRGPVLPLDSDVGHWVLNMGSDMQVIISSLRNLLLTRQGERLMNPDFGTNIHKLVFELDTSVLETQVEQEVTQAISRFEPRVTVVAVSTERPPNQRLLTVNVQVKALDQFLTLGLNYS
jgi:phage baseplate assembly protein W